MPADSRRARETGAGGRLTAGWRQRQPPLEVLHRLEYPWTTKVQQAPERRRSSLRRIRWRQRAFDEDFQRKPPGRRCALLAGGKGGVLLSPANPGDTVVLFPIAGGMEPARSGRRCHWWWCLLLGLAGCAPAAHRFYPLGIYSVPTTNDLAVVRAAGFNLVTGPATTAYFDAAQAAGLRVLAAPGTAAGPHFDAARARQRVAALDRHPACWAWSLCDEPDFNRVPPEQVRQAGRFLKSLDARRPTALTLFQGYDALDYAGLADLVLVDRYPIPWLPLANFGQHLRQARLALGPRKPLIAIIQAFDWRYYARLLPGETRFRAPTLAELRCMTYCALAERANGLFYYAYDAGGWRMSEHPATWEALCQVVHEVQARRPLFEAEHLWWARDYAFPERAQAFNAALESSVTTAWLRVRHGNAEVPAGHYLLAVNNTDQPRTFRFRLPATPAEGGAALPVLGEARVLEARAGWAQDEFAPYAVHVYGPRAAAD